MNEKTSFYLGNNLTKNDKLSLETEMEVLAGVISVNVEIGTRRVWLTFDKEKISLSDILKKIENLGYKTTTAQNNRNKQEHVYHVSGMHCASCEILVEKNLLKFQGVKSVEASVNNSQVTVEYEGSRPPIKELNRVFKQHGYTFSDEPVVKEKTSPKNQTVKTIIIALTLIIGFFVLIRSGLSSLVSVNSNSALITYFLFGILAGLSSCAALVGGLILSMSKQWIEKYSDGASTMKKMEPHLMFNAGRLASYAVFGGILGALGNTLKISLTWTSLLVIAVSVLMIMLALQMLGIRSLQRFQISLPKFITRRVADESKFQGRYMPSVMGALTFLLPCGFTLTAQGLALLSGSFWQGALILFFFALGTTGPLLAIGLSSVKFSQNPNLTQRFLKVAGIVVLVFALYNINAQLNVLGAPSFSNLAAAKASSVNNNNPDQSSDSGLPPVVNGQQIIKMEASANGYKPNYFKVAVGVPVRWEVTDTGTSGCTNAVISRSLFEGQIDLTPGTTSIKEFTPTKAGKYKFSCWMGMISGVIEVVEKNKTVGSNVPVSGSATTVAANLNTNDPSLVPSGATGCGCGGGSGSCNVGNQIRN
ncbi:MAG: hypothetical protein COY66_05950 [Candidatus Kerfeldbacteria bacterium CG_4_10_14_0_8_um_filter_42_10]|uniref:HMA domain-containing protein n=1 Tax=Candidatus Kerfeldbacteria bacterium CG_4_10_14_0_8_um_filter_42_10 TaxID=2014248 RepID=A0A2M7RG98_9BACT|nr:MAG: hypothetical protein COY66_05950 [Candidatus Kerfeldbacteria bacterium CG_4_10_14_0_8_um_filter_42_10]